MLYNVFRIFFAENVSGSVGKDSYTCLCYSSLSLSSLFVCLSVCLFLCLCVWMCVCDVAFMVVCWRGVSAVQPGAVRRGRCRARECSYFWLWRGWPCNRQFQTPNGLLREREREREIFIFVFPSLLIPLFKLLVYPISSSRLFLCIFLSVGCDDEIKKEMVSLARSIALWHMWLCGPGGDEWLTITSLPATIKMDRMKDGGHGPGRFCLSAHSTAKKERP